MTICASYLVKFFLQISHKKCLRKRISYFFILQSLNLFFSLLLPLSLESTIGLITTSSNTKLFKYQNLTKNNNLFQIKTRAITRSILFISKYFSLEMLSKKIVIFCTLIIYGSCLKSFSHNIEKDICCGV